MAIRKFRSNLRLEMRKATKWLWRWCDKWLGSKSVWFQFTGLIQRETNTSTRRIKSIPQGGVGWRESSFMDGRNQQKTSSPSRDTWLSLLNGGRSNPSCLRSLVQPREIRILLLTKRRLQPQQERNQRGDFMDGRTNRRYPLHLAIHG